MKQVLHLGCGEKKEPGAIGVDIAPLKGVDVVHDISKGLPFPSATFDTIIAEHVLEHIEVKSLQHVLEEIFRVAKNHAVVKIVVPHYSGRTAWIDPTHYRGFSINVFDFYYSSTPVFPFYSKAIFSVISKRMTKNLWGTNNFILHILYNKLFIRTVNFFANMQTAFCENIWCYWVGGFDLCFFVLKVEKKI